MSPSKRKHVDVLNSHVSLAAETFLYITFHDINRCAVCAALKLQCGPRRKETFSSDPLVLSGIYFALVSLSKTLTLMGAALQVTLPLAGETFLSPWGIITKNKKILNALS